MPHYERILIKAHHYVDRERTVSTLVTTFATELECHILSLNSVTPADICYRGHLKEVVLEIDCGWINKAYLAASLYH